MILKELFNILSEELGARRLVAGELGHPVKGLAIDEEADSWLGPDEVAVTDRKNLDSRFLALVTQAGAPAVVWRTEREPSKETMRQAGELGLGLLILPASVPLRAMLSLFMRNAEGKELLQYSHKAARVLTERVGGEASVAKLADKLASLLGHSVVVEDPGGRLIASGDPTDGSRSKVLLSTLEEYGLRASRNSGVEETRRERCDRYAMLPDSFLSAPMERWQVAGTEFFWTPIGAGASEDITVGDLVEKAPIFASHVQRYVDGVLPDLTVSVGIGCFKNDPAALPDAYSEANVALKIGHRINGPSSVSTFEQIGTYKLLFRVLQKDREELETFYDETLAPLVSYDSHYGTELVQTLTTYLSNDASPLKTAADLLAHRHTIRYRLKRVRELTHLDANKSEDRERLTLGIKAMQLLARTP